LKTHKPKTISIMYRRGIFIILSILILSLLPIYCRLATETFDYEYRDDSEELLTINTNIYSILRMSALRVLNSLQKPIIQQLFTKVFQEKEDEHMHLVAEEEKMKGKDNDHSKHEQYGTMKRKDLKFLPLLSSKAQATVDTTAGAVKENLDNYLLPFEMADVTTFQHFENEPIPINPCHEPSIFASFLNIQYMCLGENVTKEEYDILVVDPANNCSMSNNTEYVCICPLDRYNVHCMNYRPFQCQLQRISPQEHCEQPPPDESYGGLELEGDYPCFRFSMNDSVQFQYNMTCMFTVPPYSETDQANLPRNETIYQVYNPDGTVTNMTWDEMQESFVYFLNHTYTAMENGTEVVIGTFALTNPLQQPMIFKVFDFNAFSDTRGWSAISLDIPEYYIGEKVFVFNVTFAHFPDQFFAGDRLYCELRIYGIEEIDMRWEKIYIDFTDRHIPIVTNTRAVVIAAVLPSVALLIIVGGIIGVIAAIRMYRKPIHKGVDKQ
jgi:hypothetical protein